MKNERSWLIWLIISTIVLFFSLQIVQPCFFLWSDNIMQFLPWYAYDWESIFEHGAVPFINFHQFMGEDYIGQGQTGVLYLPAYVAVFFAKVILRNILCTIDAAVFLHLVASAVLMFLLFRKLGISEGISFLGSLTWITFPFTILLSKSWVFIAYAAAFIPLDFYLLLLLIEKPTYASSLYLALAKMGFFFMGYVPLLQILVIMEIFFLLVTLVLSKEVPVRRAIPAYALSLLSTFFLCAPLFFPMIKTMILSASRSRILPVEELLKFGIVPQDFFRAQVFQFRENAALQAGSQIYYIGPFIFVSLLFLADGEIRKHAAARGLYRFIFIALIALLLTTPLIALFHKIPTMNLFRMQFKYYIYFLFFLIISAAILSESLIQLRSGYARAISYMLLFASIALNCLILFTSKNVTLDYTRAGPLPEIYGAMAPWKTQERIFTFWLADVPLKDLHNYMTHNFPTLYGFYGFLGYDPLISRMNLEYTLSINHYHYPGVLSQGLLDYLSRWGVRYFITRDNLVKREEIARYGQLQARYSDGEVLVYENQRALPIVYLMKTPPERVPYEFGVNEIRIHPEASQSGKIAVNVVPLEGYSYFVDGRDAGKVVAGHAPIVLEIPAGAREVVLAYRNDSVTLGAALFICYLGVSGAIFLRSRLRRGKSP